MNKEITRIGFSGGDLEKEVPTIANLFFEDKNECYLCMIDDRTKKNIKSLRKAREKAKKDYFVEWENNYFISHRLGVILKIGVKLPQELTETLQVFSQIKFNLASISSRYNWRSEFDYIPTSFLDMHYPHGGACAFQGEGHNQLVSRRWLEYGPWLTLKGENDTTMIVFHDPAASLEESYQQARIGHERMGACQDGGFIYNEYEYTTELDGQYSLEEKRFRLTVHGREVSQEEMLDACAARLYHPFGEDKPVERVVFLFLEEENARKHLHELWLRELECWTIIKGEKVRIDTDYNPKIEKPDWVNKLQGSLA